MTRRWTVCLRGTHPWSRALADGRCVLCKRLRDQRSYWRRALARYWQEAAA